MATIHLHQTTTVTPAQFLANALAKKVKAIEARNYQPRQA
jgi:hypothetical protein